MILSYTAQKLDLSEKCKHEPIDIISKEEWLKLVHFDTDNISTMSETEIHQRIAAIKSIEEAPHYSFN